MQTTLTQALLATPQGQEANDILRRCVHCGFCTATCPTYQLLGDELDGPRGRIYLIKQFLEGNDVTQLTQKHLDRCLLCRSCETTCPSGVEYGRLLELGRGMVEEKITRPLSQRLFRRMLLLILPFPARFSALLTLTRFFSFALPKRFRQQLFLSPAQGGNSNVSRKRKMLILEGCVQSSLAPGINSALKQVCNKLKIQLISIKRAQCCGAISHHLNQDETAKQTMRATIDAWWPHINDVEAVLSTATGCTVMLKDYERLFKDDVSYANKAKTIVSKIKDPAEVLLGEDLSLLRPQQPIGVVAYHPPCTQQHGLKQKDLVENLLKQVGIELQNIQDSHICCGSAGTYSLLQPELSSRLKRNKLDNLQKMAPELIATANIGCMTHLASEANVPVKHWIELLNNQ